MLIDLLYLFGSLFLLAWSGKKTVIHGTRAAQVLNIETMFLGSSLIAVATGLPELFVTLQSLFLDVPVLSAGAIIGSNFIDVSLVLGLPILYFGASQFATTKNLQFSELYLLCLTFVTMIFLLYLGYINRLIGITLCLMYFVNMYILYRCSLKKDIEIVLSDEELEHITEVEDPLWQSISKLLGFILILTIASRLTVSRAVALMTYLHLPASYIGTTIVAFGTSLPELTINWQAVKQKEYALAMGNSFGSVFQQGAFTLGILGIFSPNKITFTDITFIAPYIVSAYAVVMLALITQHKITRSYAVILVGLTIAYCIHLLILGSVDFLS